MSSNIGVPLQKVLPTKYILQSVVFSGSKLISKNVISYSLGAFAFGLMATSATANNQVILLENSQLNNQSPYIHQSIVVVKPYARQQPYSTGWHGGYPEVSGKQTQQAYVPPHIRIINARKQTPQIEVFALSSKRDYLVQNNNLPASIRLQAAGKQGHLPSGWYKHYQVGDVLEAGDYNHGKVITRMPRGTVRMRIDNVVMRLDEDTRKILSINLR